MIGEGETVAKGMTKKEENVAMVVVAMREGSDKEGKWLGSRGEVVVGV